MKIVRFRGALARAAVAVCVSIPVGLVDASAHGAQPARRPGVPVEFDPELVTDEAIDLLIRTDMAGRMNVWRDLEPEERRRISGTRQMIGAHRSMPWTRPDRERIERVIRWVLGPSPEQWAEIEDRLDAELEAIVERYLEAARTAQHRSYSIAIAEKWDEVPDPDPKEILEAYDDCFGASRRFVSELRTMLAGFEVFSTPEQASSLDLAVMICGQDHALRSTFLHGPGVKFDAGMELLDIEMPPHEDVPFDAVLEPGGPVAATLRTYLTAREGPLRDHANGFVDSIETSMNLRAASESGNELIAASARLAYQKQTAERARVLASLESANLAIVERMPAIVDADLGKAFTNAWRRSKTSLWEIRPLTIEHLDELLEDESIAPHRETLEAIVREGERRFDLAWDRLDVTYTDIRRAISQRSGYSPGDVPGWVAEIAPAASKLHAEAAAVSQRFVDVLSGLHEGPALERAREIAKTAAGHAAHFASAAEAGTASWAMGIPGAYGRGERAPIIRSGARRGR